MITRAQYMANSSALHHDYYSQFVTSATREFVQTRIGLAKLLKSTDPYFNDVAKHRNNGAGGWIWDDSPFNYDLMLQAGEVSKGYYPSMSTRTCVGKACARMLVSEHNGTATPVTA